jgi:hypothetical protein
MTMITAKDELAHLVDTLSEKEAERVLTLIRVQAPDLFAAGADEDHARGLADAEERGRDAQARFPVGSKVKDRYGRTHTVEGHPHPGMSVRVRDAAGRLTDHHPSNLTADA